MMYPEERIVPYVRKILKEGGSGAHTFDHTLRVHRICMDIASNMDVDIRVLGAAALLHDIGRPLEEETGETHSVTSGRMCEGFLREIGYSASEVQHVQNAIRTHRFSEGLKPLSLEGEILSDADKLDAIGAIGVFRSIAQSAVSNKGVDGFLKHAKTKLLNLRNLMYTEEAKKIAENRHRFLQGFVEQLKQEVELV